MIFRLLFCQTIVDCFTTNKQGRHRKWLLRKWCKKCKKCKWHLWVFSRCAICDFFFSFAQKLDPFLRKWHLCFFSRCAICEFFFHLRKNGTRSYANDIWIFHFHPICVKTGHVFAQMPFAFICVHLRHLRKNVLPMTLAFELEEIEWKSCEHLYAFCHSTIFTFLGRYDVRLRNGQEYDWLWKGEWLLPAKFENWLHKIVLRQFTWH